MQPENIAMYMTKDCRSSANQRIEEDDGSQTESSCNSRFKKKNGKFDKKLRSSSNNSNYKQGLINKYFRIVNDKISPSNGNGKQLNQMKKDG